MKQSPYHIRTLAFVCAVDAWFETVINHLSVIESILHSSLDRVLCMYVVQFVK